MKRSIHPLLLVLFIGIVSFAVNAQQQETSITPGIYGIHGSGSVILELNEDRSFRYKNEADPSNPIDVNGTWEDKGLKVYLKNYPDDVRIPEVWKVDADHQCIRSQMTSFLIIRLCHTGRSNSDHQS